MGDDLAQCPECDDEVIDDDGQGIFISCASCGWEGTYGDTDNA